MINKPLIVTAAITSLAAIGLLYLYVGASEARAVAEAQNRSYEAQIALQGELHAEAMAQAEQQREDYQEAMRRAAAWREDLRHGIAESREVTEGASALISDEQWLCASEPSPALFVDSVRINAARRRNENRAH